VVFFFFGASNMLTIEFTSSNQPGLTFDQATATNAVYLGSNGTIYATLQGNLFPVSPNDVTTPVTTASALRWRESADVGSCRSPARHHPP
jgi:hypothetical protein